MSDVYVIRNQLGHYWGKSKEWVDGTDARAVMRAKHEDEAINTLFELSSKDVELRGEVVEAALNAKGNPMVDPSDHLLTKDTDGVAAATEDAVPDQT